MKISILHSLILTCLISCTYTRIDLEWESATGCGDGCEICNPYFDICERCGPSKFYSQTSQKCENGAISNCQYYTSSNTCSICNPGYRVQGGQCQLCTVANCSKCETNVSICEACLSTHTKSSSIANDCALGCSVLNCKACVVGNSNQCDVCNDGFRRTGDLSSCDLCTFKNCSDCSANVAQCNTVSTGKICLPAFFYNQTACVECTSGCKQCGRDGLCESCDTSKGFYMFMDMVCKGGELKFGFWGKLFVIFGVFFVAYF